MRWLSINRGLVIALVVVACNRGDKDLEAKYKQARDSVSLGDKWSAATTQLEQMLGPPQAKQDLEWRWAVVKNDFCYDVRIMKWESADKVKGVMGGAVNSAVPDRFERCSAVATGKR